MGSLRHELDETQQRAFGAGERGVVDVAATEAGGLKDDWFAMARLRIAELWRRVLAGAIVPFFGDFCLHHCAGRSSGARRAVPITDGPVSCVRRFADQCDRETVVAFAADRLDRGGGDVRFGGE